MESLTSQEIRVLKLYSEGNELSSIGQKLKRSKQWVRVNLRSAARKLNVAENDISEAIKVAREAGLI